MLSDLIKPININSSECVIYLSKGVYDVYILGGWSVKLGKFNFLIKNIDSDKVIKLEDATLQTQDYFKRKRAKKMFSVTINNSGQFKIKFKNQRDLIVNKSILSQLLFWQKPISVENIEIKFERN